MSNKSGTAPQVVSLPAGGGALPGIGETFAPDLFTGTGNFTVPIGTPEGRRGFGPQLALRYTSGGPNGPFGLGWDIGVPEVHRKTSAGVPRYGDGDTFVLAGVDELVATGPAGRFRPRVERSFSRIERGDAGWRVADRDGTVQDFTEPVTDPAAPAQVYAWKLHRTTDPFGNRIEHRYRADGAQRYLERVDYVDYEQDGETRFLVSVQFTYAERPDPFTTHRPGFALRTRLRCRRIEVHTHADRDRLVRSYQLDYVDERVATGELGPDELPANGGSLLSRVRVVGHDGNRVEAQAPIEFGYSRFSPGERRFETVAGEGGTLPLVSLGSDDLDTVDLFGDGLPDLVELNGSTRFWRNRGGGRFDPPQEMDEVPAGVRLRDPGVQFADMNGDGRSDLLVLAQRGYYLLAFGGRWSPQGFVRYPATPAVDFAQGDLRLVDLDGDGVIDALRTGTQFELFFNDPVEGWNRVETRPRRPLEEFPDVTFADPRVQLADIDGDGLQDIVLVSQGRIDYWPALGHGRWGRRVTMTASPRFEDRDPLPGGFDPGRVLFGDLDGDGLDDIVYVQADRLTFWINQSGQGWSDPVTVEGTPQFTDIDGVRLTDLLGHGVLGVLWSNDSIPGSDDHYRFLDLTGGTKPYLLRSMDNHRGAVTRVEYAPSTRFISEDQHSPITRWRTSLPFPVQTVARIEVRDELTEATLTTRVSYGHGQWDGVEREFRGFGYVERVDTETRPDEAHFSPPVVTRTWFHVGPVGEEFEDWAELDLSSEHWPDDPAALGHTEQVDELLAALPDTPSRRDALRALGGSILRSEVYARDGTERATRPYSVSEHAYAFRQEAPGVFFPHEIAERVSRWERGPEAMTRLVFSDAHDAYGLPGRRIELAVPRGRDFRSPSPGAEPYLGTVTVTERAQRDDAARFIVDRIARETSHEIVEDGGRPALLIRDAVRAGDLPLAIVGQVLHHYDGAAFVGLPVGRLGDFGARVRTETLALTEARAAEAFGSALPPYLVAGTPPPWTAEYPTSFRARTPALAGYRFSAGDDGTERGWFVASGRCRYDVHGGRAGQGLVTMFRDEMGRRTTVRHDRFGLLTVDVAEPAGLRTRVRNDYRVLQPDLVTDPNGNRSAYRYTPLGLLESTATMGRAGEPVGDTTATPGLRLHYDHLAWTERRQPVQVRAVQRVHHVQDADLPADERDATIEAVEYTDGFGRLVQTRRRAQDTLCGDPTFGQGVLPTRRADPSTDDVVSRTRNADAPANVVVSGWQTYDNKGRVVEQFEPFFSEDFTYRTVAEERQEAVGHKVTLGYDPLGRVVRVRNADGTERTTVVGVPGTIAAPDLADPARFEPTPWESYVYDENDNAARAPSPAAPVDPRHLDTPSSIELDALGRPAVSIRRTGPEPDDRLVTRQRHDIRGNVVEVTDPAGRPSVRHTYDLLDRPLRFESLDAGTHHSVLDAAGNELERRDGRGALVLRAHDVRQRPVLVWARDSATGEVTQRERIVYGDAPDAGLTDAQRVEAKLRGQVYQHFDEAGMVRAERYDLHGNLIAKTRRVLADTAVLSAPEFRIDWEQASEAVFDQHVYRCTAAYDALRRLRFLELPDDVEGKRRQLLPRYDAGGNLVRLTLDGEVFVDHASFDAGDRRTLVALGNGVLTRCAYHPRSQRLVRLRSEAYTHPTGDGAVFRPAGSITRDLVYGYDPIGNITSLSDRAAGVGVPGTQLGPDGLDRSLAYDPLYRLVRATGRECGARPTEQAAWSPGPRCTDLVRARAYTETFRYDSAGNLTLVTHQSDGTRTTRALASEPGRNRLATVTAGQTVVAYAHDANGNIVQETTSRHFVWDHENRLRTFRTQAADAEPSLQAHYLYDSNGQRVKKLVRRQGGAVETTVYVDGLFEHHRWVAGDGPAANNHIHVSDEERRVALVRAVRYDLDDHLGSSALALDAGGNLLGREEFTPYGETSFGSFTRKRYRFMGKERDEESGLAYHGARYVAPWLGRWTSCDPAHDDPGRPAAGLNPYTAFGSNPIRYVDDDGANPNDPPGQPPGRVRRWFRKFVFGVYVTVKANLPGAVDHPEEWMAPRDRQLEGQQSADENRRKRRGTPSGGGSPPGGGPIPGGDAPDMPPEKSGGGRRRRGGNGGDGGGGARARRKSSAAGSKLAKFGSKLGKFAFKATIVGDVLGVVTAVRKFADGDWKGGLRELAGSVPVLGTALDIAEGISDFFGSASETVTKTLEDLRERLEMQKLLESDSFIIIHKRLESLPQGFWEIPPPDPEKPDVPGPDSWRRDVPSDHALDNVGVPVLVF